MLIFVLIFLLIFVLILCLFCAYFPAYLDNVGGILVWTQGHVWTFLDMSGHVWTCLDMFGHVWTCWDAGAMHQKMTSWLHPGQRWRWGYTGVNTRTCLDMFGHVQMLVGAMQVEKTKVWSICWMLLMCLVSLHGVLNCFQRINILL